jgi:uridylate kinase
MPAVAEPFIRRKALRHMEKGRVIILAGGTGVPYVTTDTGSSLHALELHCDIVMKATKVDGIYDKDPKKFPDAKRYKTIKFTDILKNPDRSRGLCAMAMYETTCRSWCSELFKNETSRKPYGEDLGTIRQ